ncbi:MAG: FHA domain-containing protein [Chloroflexi bacterium]|nr:FHA domain-containing protein [Chloroflexota bacterium]
METRGKLVLTLSTGTVQEFGLQKASVSLGRSTTNDIALRDSKTSRVHAKIECTATGCTLSDLASANGTRVNGQRIDQVTLEPGDVITIGDNTLRFETASQAIDESPIVAIDSNSDLEATLAHGTLSMKLNDTNLPRLAIRTTKHTWHVDFIQDALIIGRDSSNAVALDDPKASRQHARIERRGDAFVLRDLKSRNGTWVGGKRIDEYTLDDGDTIRVGDAQLVFKRGFQTQDLTIADNAATLIETPSAKRMRYPIVIVPGLMGSELWQGSECFWPNARYLFTNPEIYAYSDKNNFQVRGLVRDVVIVPNLIKLEQYGRLGDYLEEELGYERGKNLFEFAYDWRQDVRLSARQLAQAIDTWKITSPFILIAHSLGCLVSRYFVEQCGGKNHVARLLLVGGPHYGVPQTLTGLLYGKGLLPFGLMGDRIRTALVTFPSVYQILPTYPCVFDQINQPIDVLADESWVAESQRPLLRAAYDFRKELGTRTSVPTVSIFGYGLRTVTRLNVQRDSDGKWQNVTFVNAEGGDDTIPDTSTVLENSEIHPVEQHHGSLYVDSDVKMRLKLELTR